MITEVGTGAITRLVLGNMTKANVIREEDYYFSLHPLFVWLHRKDTIFCCINQLKYNPPFLVTELLLFRNLEHNLNIVYHIMS